MNLFQPVAIRHLWLFLWLIPAMVTHAFVALPNPDPGATTPNPSQSPGGVWHALGNMPAEVGAKPAWVRPAGGRPYRLTVTALRPLLDTAQQRAITAPGTLPVIHLPMPDGSFARFHFAESSVMAPELAAKFPEIRTYLGTGVDDPAATVRFDLTPAGFHAQILSPKGAVYIDPYSQGDTEHYTSVFQRDYARSPDGFVCLVDGPVSVTSAPDAPPGALRSSGNQLRTYRLAVGATAEYTAYHGGTVSAGLAAIVTAVNRVSGVYEIELGVRFVLVANNDLIVYTNASADPYSNNSGTTMLTQNQTTLDAVIGGANYDIGHVFSTGGGGVASLGVVCVTGSKARGVTGLPMPIGDSFYIDYVAHEMGHQFGANHTFNSQSGNCGGGNRAASAAYEPGSGSTIMAYAGICPPDDFQTHSDPYFHWKSYDEIQAFVTTGSGSACPVVTSTGNTIPTVTAGPAYTIPANTPFTLTASGSDPDDDALTYGWEQSDLGVAQLLTDPDNGSSPLFRSFTATSDPARTFPKLSAILAGTSSLGEKLPSTTRALHFRVTARDNRADGGGVNNADTTVSVTSGAGPFVVTSPNSPVSWSGARTVTWNVAGTTNAPVSAALVNILLSTNGGNSFPYVLATNTPNDGTASVTLPNIDTAAARIKVAGADNIFFDISDANFTISPVIPQPLVQIASVTLASEGCTPTNGVVDPGETVTFNVALRNDGTANTTNLVVTLLTQGGVTNLALPQNYGALLAAGSTVTQAFTLTAGGTCGTSVVASFQLQDNASNLGSLTNTFLLGTVATNLGAYTNIASLTVPVSGGSGPASLYPSTVNVGGMIGTVSKVTVTLRGLSHTRPRDLDVLLVAPNGQTVMLMSDVGGTTAINNLTLTFDDAVTNSLPDSLTFGPGIWKPTNIGTTDAFDAGPPAGPYGATLALLNGANPNGAWALYVEDDSSMGGTSAGSLAQGWSLSLVTMSASCCSTPVADGAITSLTPAVATNAGSVVTLTYAVTNAGPDPSIGLQFADTVPAGLQFVSATSAIGVCTNDNGVVRCAFTTLPPGTGGLITLQFLALTNGAITNLAALTFPGTDPVTSNNVAGTVLTLNSVPVISTVANRATAENTPLGPINFTVEDAETAADALIVQATSLNPAVISGLSLGGSGTNRTITLTPAPGASGMATINLTVGDGAAQATNSFTVTVLAPPVIESITVTNGTVTLTWQSVATQSYRVQFKPMLEEPDWTDLPGDVVASGSSASKSDTPGEDSRYYRVRVLLP